MSSTNRFFSWLSEQRSNSHTQDIIGFFTASVVCSLIVLVSLNFETGNEIAVYIGSGIFAFSLLALLTSRHRAFSEIEDLKPASLVFLSSPFLSFTLWSALLAVVSGALSQQGIGQVEKDVFLFAGIIFTILVLVTGHLPPLVCLTSQLPVFLLGILLYSSNPENLTISLLLGISMICASMFSFRNWSAKLNEVSLSNANERLSVKTRFIEALKTDLNSAQVRADQAEKALRDQERSFEIRLQDQTKELSDTNTQLSQQIGLKQKISDALLKSQTRLNQAIEASNLGMFDWDLDKNQFYQSALLQYFGPKEQSSEEVIHTLKAVIHPQDYPGTRDTLNLCLAGNQERYQVRYRVKNESDWVWIEECGKVAEKAANGAASRILGTRRDIHAEVTRNEQIRLAKSVFDHTSEGVFVLDKQGQFLSANPAYTEISGYDETELIGKSIVDVSNTPQKTELYAQIFAELHNAGKWSGEILEQRCGGDFYPQWTQINAIYNDQKEIQYFAGLISDLSNRKEVDEKLNYLLNYDDTTKLANRFQFKDQLHRALLRFRNESVPFALLIFDIDRFKRFNDSFGHDRSDDLLLAFADRLNEYSGEVDLMSRIGGNEFACILPCTDEADLLNFAEQALFHLTRKPYLLGDQEVVISCSVGLAMVPKHASDIENLVQYTHSAVQKAKYQGGQHIQIFDDSLKRFTPDKLALEQELRHAISNQELQVYYQPKLDLVTGQISSYEALVRWVHPTRGDISPEEFVHIAEECGLISDLGAYVLQVACNQTQQWVKQGLGDLHVSVNLSPRQIKESGIKQVIESAVLSTGILPERLEMELTESAIMEDISGAVEVLNELRDMGINISVDDFGTGYSSLNYLQKLPVDTLKIDRAFITGLEHSTEQQAIARAILVMGSTLNLKVVAEGVENEAQLAFLHEHNCDLVQGYLISKPIEAADMQRILEKQKHKVA